MTDKEKVLRFNFRGSYDDLEPAENGEIMRAFDYDRLAAKLDTATPLDDPRVKALVEALRRMVYETTSLSPLEDDGSHWCKISKDALAQARAALSALEENK